MVVSNHFFKRFLIFTLMVFGGLFWGGPPFFFKLGKTFGGLLFFKLFFYQKKSGGGFHRGGLGGEGKRGLRGYLGRELARFSFSRGHFSYFFPKLIEWGAVFCQQLFPWRPLGNHNWVFRKLIKKKL